MNNTTLTSSKSEYSGLVAALAATMVAALVPMFVMDRFRETFAAFGADVPAITAFFLHHHLWLFAIPAAILGLWALLAGNPRRDRLVATIGTLCAVVTFLAMVGSMYLPVWELSATI